jgi:hypothetical protein
MVVEMIFADSAAVARLPFESGHVKDVDRPTSVLDKSAFFEHGCSDRYSRATGSQHAGKKLMRHLECVAVCLIGADEEATGKTLFQLVFALHPAACIA